MEIEQWLGADNNLGIDIWNKKYCYNGETFDQWLDRVSEGDAELRQLIIDKKFLFGGRILANRGLQKTGLKVTFSNCYVLSPPEDSIESIFDTASKAARTFSYGGGVGIDLSKLAPRGAKINNTASETSGVRLGTPAVTTRGFKEKEMKIVGDLILKAIFDFDMSRGEILSTVDELCTEFPLY